MPITFASTSLSVWVTVKLFHRCKTNKSTYMSHSDHLEMSRNRPIRITDNGRCRPWHLDLRPSRVSDYLEKVFVVRRSGTVSVSSKQMNKAREGCSLDTDQHRSVSFHRVSVNVDFSEQRERSFLCDRLC